MTVITINGQIGTGGPEIAVEIARRLGFDYLDHTILAEAARRLGATEVALAEKEQRSPSHGERLAQFLQTVMERSALTGAGGDPYFGPSLGILLGQDYTDAAREPITRADQVNDDHFIETTKAVIHELANSGEVVITGRASNFILKDHPDAFHVGLVSSDMGSRIKIIANRLEISPEEAEKIVNDQEKARVAYFRKFFKVTTSDPESFHIMLDTHRFDRDRVSSIIIQAAGL
ncbi:MAG: cytidylate kinase-like family protein [Dehalococcoidia bacterium]